MENHLVRIMFFLAVHSLSGSSLQEVHILPDECSQNRTFLNISKFCQEASGIVNDTTVIILNGIHNLDMPCEVRGVNNFLMKGEAEELNVIINCSNGGFRFLNVVRLSISKITFAGCGASWAVTKPQLASVKLNILSALLFLNGSDLTLTSVTVLDAKSAGIYVYNVAGSVKMNSCEVINASSYKVDTLSGNIIVYDDYMSADSARLSISNSQFNSSGYSNRTTCRINSKLLRFHFSSGLVLFLGNSKVTIAIDNTKFSHNTGCNGGNIAVLFFKFMPVTISHSDFIGGYSSFGGGAYLSFENSFLDWIYKSTNYRYLSKVLSITDSKFVNNTAEWNGGGVYVHWKQSLLLNGSVDVSISRTIFDNNFVGKYDGGMAFYYQTYLEDSDNPKSVSKLYISLNVSNSTFHNHYPSIPSNKFQPEYSVILATNVPYFGVDGITVKNNNCTAIQAVGSTVVFYGSTRIFNNSALTGAGIKLCSGALIYLTAHTNLIITNNSAEQTGGGLQVYLSNCLLTIPKCFYQYTRDISRNLSLLETINFKVANNSANKSGDNIFGGSIDYCYLLWVPLKQNVNKYFIDVPFNSIPKPSSISSNPQQVCFDFTSNEGKLDCTRNSSAHIYPGEKMSILVRVVGQLYGSVSGTVVAHIDNGGEVGSNEKIQAVNESGGIVSYTVYPLAHNLTNTTIILKAGLHSDSEYSSHNFPARIQIHFKQCPFGFINAELNPSSSRHACQCITSKKISISNCSIQNLTITKQSRSWLGEFQIGNRSYLASNKYCPLDYCNNSFLNIKIDSNKTYQNEQCQYHRTGILCGSCPSRWSMVLGSSECQKCSNMWLLLVVPFALAGVLLVIIIHFLNLTVTMGTICGLIFYANIIQDYFITLLTLYPIPGLTPVLQIFLSWLNLDLGISTCFYDGMEAFGKTMLLFVFPIYIWLISTVIIFLSNHYIFFTRIVGENALKVLSTLFLLSYSKMLRVTIGILSLKVIEIHFNDSVITKVRWTTDGNIPYLDPKRHLAAFLVAILFAVLLLPFSMSLLCIRHVFALSNYCRVFSWIDKLKPLFDTYTGPFKDNARFWTGLLLFVRLFLLVVHTLDYHYDVIPYYIIILICMALSLMITVLQGVYKDYYLNVLEHFFIWNLTFIFLLNTYIGGQEKWRSILCHILVSSAFLVFLGVIAYHIYLKFSQLGLKIKFWQRQNAEMEILSYEGVRSYDSIND